MKTASEFLADKNLLTAAINERQSYIGGIETIQESIDRINTKGIAGSFVFTRTEAGAKLWWSLNDEYSKHKENEEQKKYAQNRDRVSAGRKDTDTFETKLYEVSFPDDQIIGSFADMIEDLRVVDEIKGNAYNYTDARFSFELSDEENFSEVMDELIWSNEVEEADWTFIHTEFTYVFAITYILKRHEDRQKFELGT